MPRKNTCITKLKLGLLSMQYNNDGIFIKRFKYQYNGLACEKWSLSTSLRRCKEIKIIYQ